MDIKICRIFEDHLYSVRYEDKDKDEYNRLFDEWNNLDYLEKFFNDHIDELKNPYWCRVPVPELAMQQVVSEANDLEDDIEKRVTDNSNGDTLDGLFYELGGKYKGCKIWVSQKAYGPDRPSLIRLYAIKIDDNCYLIIGGGIKLRDTIQESPELNEHVLKDIDRVREYLRITGISDASGLEDDE